MLLIAQVVEMCMNLLEDTPLPKSAGVKKLKRTASSEDLTLSGDALRSDHWLALNYLSVIMEDTKMRQTLISKEPGEGLPEEAQEKLVSLFQGAFQWLDNAILGSRLDAKQVQFLLKAIGIYFKYIVHEFGVTKDRVRFRLDVFASLVYSPGWIHSWTAWLNCWRPHKVSCWWLPKRPPRARNARFIRLPWLMTLWLPCWRFHWNSCAWDSSIPV